MRISIYLFTTSHTHILLTTPTSHTHRFHPLSKIVIHTSVQYGSAEAWMTILESGWNQWVWLVGVVSRRWVWLVVKRYIDTLTVIINFPYSTCVNSFFGSSILTSLFFKCFFGLLHINHTLRSQPLVPYTDHSLGQVLFFGILHDQNVKIV